MPHGVTWAILSSLAVAVQLLSACNAHAADSPAQCDLVIRGGRVIDPESGLDGVRDIGVREGRIARIAKRTLVGRKTLDASGLVVAPGFIDLHSHAVQLLGARVQAHDGVTTALELEGGVLPVPGFYDRIAARGWPINYGASASWALARAHHHDLEQVRALLGHVRIETTQVYAQIQPAQLKASVSFYEGKAVDALTK